MFPREMLIEMISIQNQLNKGMAGSGWLLSDNTTRPYYRAAYMEAAEGIDHHGYKWWKKFDPTANLSQLKLEVIDMLLFILSDELRTTYTSVVNSEDNYVTMDGDNVSEESENRLIEVTADRIIAVGTIDIPSAAIGAETFVLVAEQFIAQAILRKHVTVRNWGALADAINLSMEEAGLWYIGKAALNFHRDNNGQKEGNYAKTWWGKEDNIFLEHVIHAIKEGKVVVEEDSLMEAVTSYLTEQYRRLQSGEQALEL